MFSARLPLCLLDDSAHGSLMALDWIVAMLHRLLLLSAILERTEPAMMGCLGDTVRMLAQREACASFLNGCVRRALPLWDSIARVYTHQALVYIRPAVYSCNDHSNSSSDKHSIPHSLRAPLFFFLSFTLRLYLNNEVFVCRCCCGSCILFWCLCGSHVRLCQLVPLLVEQLN